MKAPKISSASHFCETFGVHQPHVQRPPSHHHRSNFGVRRVEYTRNTS
ncbi:hypothetical protein ERO13_D11G160200v2 [Gossypium hirsutum]|uniref:Uncharacterized protein n=3 Tax=Gossypium TaxID=3633 RepID=A0A5J5PC30_GOSBA|nr:hypothetical protein ES319_D11G168000v1 [Gossypium barbadense]KAG4120709.1 hypothetical protein ERO13_D11G160200v2 [Gossypium hirsutum]TYG45483.1 hypothetical protein ES288_D11G177600v1 [Gossypium darwinii]TYH44158.1 hypothetical protein ES332_D11G174400v1 [Gossypium tomentosum]